MKLFYTAIFASAIPLSLLSENRLEVVEFQQDQAIQCFEDVVKYFSKIRDCMNPDLDDQKRSEIAEEYVPSLIASLNDLMDAVKENGICISKAQSEELYARLQYNSSNYDLNMARKSCCKDKCNKCNKCEKCNKCKCKDKCCEAPVPPMHCDSEGCVVDLAMLDEMMACCNDRCCCEENLD